jgi:hypothetical protein
MGYHEAVDEQRATKKIAKREKQKFESEGNKNARE